MANVLFSCVCMSSDLAIPSWAGTQVSSAWALGSHAAVDMGVQSPLSISFKCVPRSGIAGSHDSSVFNSFRKCLYIFRQFCHLSRINNSMKHFSPLITLFIRSIAFQKKAHGLKELKYSFPGVADIWQWEQ